MSIISNTMTEIRNDLQNATSTVDHNPRSIFWDAVESIARSKSSYYYPTTLDTGKKFSIGQSVSSIGWSDYAIEPVEQDCSEAECGVVDQMAAKLAAMETRLMLMESQWYQMVDKAEKAEREVVALNMKLRTLEASNQSIEYRVQRLQHQQYDDNAKQYTDNANYQKMLQRIIQMEQAINPMQQTYYGGAITCGTSTTMTSLPTAATSPSRIDWEKLNRDLQATTVGVVGARGIAGPAGVAGPTGISASTYNQLYNNVTTGFEPQ